MTTTALSGEISTRARLRPVGYWLVLALIAVMPLIYFIAGVIGNTAATNTQTR